VTRAFSGMEDALVSFTTTGKADFKGLVQSIIADMARIAIKQQITAPLASLLSGGGSSSGAGGSNFGTLLSWASALFGGGSSGGMGINNTGTNLPTAGGRALGGPVSAGSLYRINERGPEVLRQAGRNYLLPSAPGTVTPTSDGGSGRALNVTMHFNVDQPASRATQAQVMTSAARGLQRVLAKGNA
jgi:lambda family phage tail tape measure protein